MKHAYITVQVLSQIMLIVLYYTMYIEYIYKLILGINNHYRLYNPIKILFT